jgi:hypothetical protein
LALGDNLQVAPINTKRLNLRRRITGGINGKHQTLCVGKKSDAVSRLSIFGPPPLLYGEDTKVYDDLLARISSAMNPSDILDEISVRDITDITWEIRQLRRAKATLIADAVPGQLLSALEPSQEYSEDGRSIFIKPAPKSLHELIDKWAEGDTAAISKVEKLMASIKLTMGTIADRAFLENLEQIERIERLITIYEDRRRCRPECGWNSVWRDLQ